MKKLLTLIFITCFSVNCFADTLDIEKIMKASTFDANAYHIKADGTISSTIDDKQYFKKVSFYLKKNLKKTNKINFK